MEKPPFENLTCIICNLGHWVLAGLVAIGVVAYLTRGYWGPGVRPTPTPAQASTSPTTSIPAAAELSPVAPATPATDSPISFPTPDPEVEWAEYINPLGDYSLAYPTEWEGTETDTDASFMTREAANVQVLVAIARPGYTAADYAGDEEWLGSAVPLNSSPVVVDGEQAIRLELAEGGATTVTSITYVVVHADRLYLLAFAGLKGQPQAAIARDTAHFEAMVASFQFSQ